MNALSSFKSRAIYVAAALAIGLSSTTTKAQYQADRVQFVAPFAFEYGSQHLPAGKYVVSRESSAITLIRGRSVGVMAITQTTSDLQPASKGKIVFRKYGQRYFLTQVWLPGKASHLTFDQKKAMRKLEVAAGNAEPTKVEVALLEPTR
ncbi:hypothetical protein HDF16_003506 [Granulicella aggregans]|uniref:DUF2846 domain-containing protein n=1 Tax=Granulicella aggregans TaxID=474949 RepID=A0A7W7ZFD3_9BACT|nr:hypothetical protein [Granulicella aggregans]MBB5058792.1 hypothetical protein [Granulicella aggregans]